jgi:predicted ATPase/DNA-binding CsgD family transcriptional regulator/Tfp pilus assembly protein PilF
LARIRSCAVPSPGNLPLQLTGFIGREREIAEVKRLLDSSRLLTLTGPGGAGKTRLALEVVTRTVGDYGGGVYFVNLAPVRDPDMVAVTIAHTLSLSDAGNRPVAEALKSHLQGRDILLLLDNFEQVSSAATLLVDLLSSVPDFKVLVTSREPLHVTGEQQFQVPPLALPPTGDSSIAPPAPARPPEDLAAYESVALFVERARAANSDFRLTGANAPVVAQICQRLDGLPLAIELAAARVRHLSPHVVLDRLDRRLRLLTGGPLNAPARHQTLTAAIEWSYELLAEQEKKLFRRLAAFQGRRTLDALEAVCNYDRSLELDMLEGISALVDKNLVRQGTRKSPDGESYFWLLETIHEYAREKLLESGEAFALQREHALYFMRLVEAAEPHLTGARQQEWLDKLEAEHNNIRTALRWARESNDDEATEIGLRIGAGIWRFWDGRAYVSEGREALLALLRKPVSKRADAQRGRGVRAKALNAVGLLEWRQGLYAQAQASLEEALALAAETGDTTTRASALYNLGLVAWHRGDYAAARSLHEESLALRLEAGDKLGIAYSFHQLANLAYLEGDYDAARHGYEQALTLQRELDNRRAIALALNGLGNVAYMKGDYASAQALHRDGLALQNELGDKWGTALSLGNLGNIAYSSGDYAGAERLYREALTIGREIWNTYSIAFCLGGLGAAASAGGRPTRGARLLAATEAILQAAGAVLDSDDRIVYAAGLASARDHLPGEEFDKAWKEGRALSRDQAIAYALEDLPEVESGPARIVGAAPGQSPHSDLSRREREVLRLLARGLSNEQIAERMFLSTNTVRAHLYSIYGKLGVSNRVAAIRVAEEQ